MWTITLLGENLVLLMTFAETGVLINASIIRVHDCLTRFISDMSIQFVTCPGNETCFYFDPFVFENLMMFIHPCVNVVYTFVCVCVCVCIGLFSSAAEAGPHDILKMYTPEGSLVNISNRLESNRPDAPYRLELVAAHFNQGF